MLIRTNYFTYSANEMFICSILHKGWVINPIMGGGVIETEEGTTRLQRDRVSFHIICREFHWNHATLIWILATNKICLM
jgi:hypothetical protein